MKDKNKIVLNAVLFFLGSSIFILQLFVFEGPDGVFGFLLCLFSCYLIIGSIINLCRLNENIKNFILNFLNLLFWGV